MRRGLNVHNLFWKNHKRISMAFSQNLNANTYLGTEKVNKHQLQMRLWLTKKGISPSQRPCLSSSKIKTARSYWSANRMMCPNKVSSTIRQKRQTSIRLKSKKSWQNQTFDCLRKKNKGNSLLLFLRNILEKSRKSWGKKLNRGLA